MRQPRADCALCAQSIEERVRHVMEEYVELQDGEQR
jgi:hypothetical protein